MTLLATPAPPGNQARREAAAATARRARPVPLAKALDDAARSLDLGTDPAMVAARLRRFARNTDPAITITLTR